MSKSLNNYVGVDESPEQIYAKLMSAPDTLMRRYYDLLSSLSIGQIESIFTKLSLNQVHPKDVKSEFAMEMVRRFHSPEDADRAKATFEKVVSRKEIPDDIQTFQFQHQGHSIWLPKLLHEVGMVSSTSEGKRMVQQGAVRINEEVFTDEHYRPDHKENFVLQCGKRKFARIQV